MRQFFARASRLSVLSLIGSLVLAACGGGGGGSDGGGGGGPAPIAQAPGQIPVTPAITAQWLYQNVTNLSLNAPDQTTWAGEVLAFHQGMTASDTAGRVYALWNEPMTSLHFTRSNDQGTTWMTPVRLDPTGIGPLSPSMAAGPDGTAYVVWVETIFLGGDVYMKRITPTDNTLPVLTVSSGPTTPTAGDESSMTTQTPGQPTVLVGWDNVVHIFWTEVGSISSEKQVWHRAYDPATNSFSVITRLSEAALSSGKGDYKYGGQYLAVLDGANNVHAFWLADIDDDSDDRGDMDGTGSDTAGTVDPADDTTDRRGLRYRYRAAGFAGTWNASAENPVPGPQSGSFYPTAAGTTRLEAVYSADVATDNYGRVHMAFTIDRGQNATKDSALLSKSGPDDVFYVLRQPGTAGTWGAIQAVSQSADTPGGDLPHIDDTHKRDNTTFAVAPDGTAHVTWIDNNAAGQAYYVRYKRIAPGGSFAGQTATLLDTQKLQGTPKLGRTESAVDGNGWYTVVYERHTHVSDGWWIFPASTQRDLYAATVKPNEAYTSANLKKLNPGNLQAAISAVQFRYSHILVLFSAQGGSFFTMSPYATTRNPGSLDWSTPTALDTEVDLKNGVPNDGWLGRGAIQISPSRYHAFFDQFATHPGPVDSVNDAPDNYDPNNPNDPEIYTDPNQDPDSYDLFHIRTQ